MSETRPLSIAIGADHRGTEAARRLAAMLDEQGHTCRLIGPCASTEGTDAPCDYPEPAYHVAKLVASGAVDRGILICGTGIGMSIAANKVKGVRAAVVHDELTANLSRSHNDANVMCVSADLLGLTLIEKIAEVWLATDFAGGRHQRRVDKIKMIEDGIDPASAN